MPTIERTRRGWIQAHKTGAIAIVCDIENDPVEIVDLSIEKWGSSIVFCMFTRD
jgi:hypothetical protein